MLTIGVDLAAQPAGTAICWIKWSDVSAEAYQTQQPVGDEQLLDSFQTADKTGIDVPFGWPSEFVKALVAYRRRTAWPTGDSRLLRFRETDRFVRRITGKWPLSVSSERIAATAMRAARLFSRLVKGEIRVDRAGTGRLVEVYPAAALKQWGFSYKRREGHQGRRNLLIALEGRTREWLHVSGTVKAKCEESADALDALIAAMVARAAARGLCEPIPEEARERARREGWIALPRPDSLDRLASEDLSKNPGKGAGF